MKTLTIIFPVCLFADIKDIKGDCIIIEEHVNFIDFKYHKMKLLYHRATMRAYYDYLRKKKVKVDYIEYTYKLSELLNSIKEDYDKVVLIDPVDHLIMDKWVSALNKKHIQYEIVESKNFLLTIEEMTEYNNKYVKSGKYYHDKSFYPWMRKKLNVLMKNNKPIGGKWSFDKENRESMPEEIQLPSLPKVINNRYIAEARKYVEKHFGDNYGETKNMIYPINHSGALKWLRNFISKKLSKFGEYQDAVSKEHPFMFHSVISPMLNIGLLTDRIVLNEVLTYITKHKLPINSVEGFLRQLIGWRNYVRLIYHFKGREMREMNFFKHKNKLNEKWWKGETGIDPIDGCINQSIKWCYLHHIQRLMYMGNIMLLCQIDPNEVYTWFMEIHSIDAYDVFMVPNVYGMSQYADGGLMLTRPYFSSGNYILKMSDYPKGTWVNKWHALYYTFINTHQKTLSKIYATAMMVKMWNKKGKAEQKELLQMGKDILKGLIKN